jgi:hypothetical protein
MAPRLVFARQQPHFGAQTPGAGAIHPICFWRIPDVADRGGGRREADTPEGRGGGELPLRGDLATNRPRFRLQPLTNDCGEVAAITVEMMGLTFALRLEPPEVIGDVILDKPYA